MKRIQKANASHTHDDRYFTEAEVNNKLNGKSNTDHTHHNRYHTKSETISEFKSPFNIIKWENGDIGTRNSYQIHISRFGESGNDTYTLDLDPGITKLLYWRNGGELDDYRYVNTKQILISYNFVIKSLKVDGIEIHEGNEKYRQNVSSIHVRVFYNDEYRLTFGFKNLSDKTITVIYELILIFLTQ